MEKAAPSAMRGARRTAERDGASVQGAPATLRFVGRQAELDVVRESFEAAMRGRGSILAIGGEAGIGKSRLAWEAVRFARAVAGRGGIGRCLDFAPSPLGPFIDALRDAGVTPPAQSAEWEIAEKRARLEALAGALRGAARDSALVLVIDDVQWADEGTRDALRFLAPHVHEMRLLLIASYRDDELGPSHPLRAMLAALVRYPAVRRIVLGPLTEFEMKVLLRNATEGRRQALADRLPAIAALAEGNPFVAEELVRNLVDGLETPLGASLSVREAVVRRLDSMATDHRRIVVRASVIGRDFDSAQLARLAGRPLEMVRDALASAIALALIAERAGMPGTYSFRHGLTQRVLVNELLSEERRELHATIAADIEARDGASDRAAELAHHWWEAGDRVRAARYARAAGDAAAAAGLASDAVAAYERALGSGSLDPADRATLERTLAAARDRAAQAGIGDEGAPLAALEAAPKNRQGRTAAELTRREREVSIGVAAGKTNRTIAEELFVSERTVEDHVGAMLRKLGLKNRAELAAFVARAEA